MRYQPPFPYFGGKSKAAPIVWERFGSVGHYIEPFFGSGAVLFLRPGDHGTETINDIDGMIANFWRAMKDDPIGVARHADWPVNELDLHARHAWLIKRKPELVEQLREDPCYFDAQSAGWWVWGISAWIGSGWCSHAGKARPHLADDGHGIHRKNMGPLQRPHLANAGQGIHRTGQHLADYMKSISLRLRRVRVCCGDWSRIVGKSMIDPGGWGTVGVFLDPPYSSEAGRDASLYSEEDLSIAHDVRDWAMETGKDRRIRIALCGYEGEHDMPGWDKVAWKANGGYGNQGEGNGRENSTKERIWFSPGCLGPRQPGLFDMEEG